MLVRGKDKPLDFVPGEKYAYSNSGYFLPGAIIEKASGVTYDEFIRTEICEPLELNDTGYDRFRTVLKHRASGYERRAGAIAHAVYLDMPQPYAAGSLYSTVEDLNRWDQALRRKELISDERCEKMYTPEKKGYAYGWGIGTKSDRKTISHGGGINGFVSYILRYPEQKLCVVLLCNVLPANPGKVAKDLAAIMLGEDYEVAKNPEVADVDPEIFDAYAGRYQIGPDFILTVKRVDDKLTTQATGQGELTILPESKTTFFNTQVKARITFVQDDSGNTIPLILKQRGREIRAGRIDEIHPEQQGPVAGLLLPGHDLVRTEFGQNRICDVQFQKRPIRLSDGDCRMLCRVHWSDCVLRLRRPGIRVDSDSGVRGLLHLRFVSESKNWSVHWNRRPCSNICLRSRSSMMID